MTSILCNRKNFPVVKFVRKICCLLLSIPTLHTHVFTSTLYPNAPSPRVYFYAPSPRVYFYAPSQRSIPTCLLLRSIPTLHPHMYTSTLHPSPNPYLEILLEVNLNFQLNAVYREKNPTYMGPDYAPSPRSIPMPYFESTLCV